MPADRPLAAGELARLAGVSAATASFHLAKLLEGGMITVVRQGRHRYYRLAGPEVAAAIEALGLISPALPVRTLRQSREAAALAEARTCYHHLAGRAGVELLAGLLRLGLIEENQAERIEVIRPPSASKSLHPAPRAPERRAGRGHHQPAVRPRLDRARRSPPQRPRHPGRY